MSPVEKQSFGTNGCVILIQDGVASGTFCAIQFITEGRIASITTSSLSLPASVIADFVFPAGFVLYVPCTEVQAGEGTNIVLYRSSL